MCGVAGFFWTKGGLTPEEAAVRVSRMTQAIVHRGPDSGGDWIDVEAGVALGHRRLAIVDLSQAGHQPMASPSGRFVLSYNGEVYNHLALRRSLEAELGQIAWRGHSDTETLVAGFAHWGIDATIARAHGMFAMAIWDRQRRALSLVRDRLGEKPMYYGWQGGTFLFGSELSALRAHPDCGFEINRAALVQMLRHGHVGEGMSILSGIHKLPAGHILELPSGDQRCYWDVAQLAAQRAPDQPVPVDPDAAANALESCLLEATDRQMTSSDVPLGAFLSGGIDSSLIVALMQHLSLAPVHSFSIGFQEKRYDEAGYARAVARHLGTRHTEHYVSDADLLDVVPQLARMFAEPFADSSQIPTFLVSKLAREHVTVALSGDGGDELFGGYDRYAQGARLMGAMGRVPLPLRRGGAAMIKRLPSGLLDRLVDPWRPVPEGKEGNGQRLHRLADYAASRGDDDLHRKLVSRWRWPERGVVGGGEAASLLWEHVPPRGDLSTQERMMQLDLLTYLPDDILAKVDRAAMAVSLETRAPLLDHKVAEFALACPLDMKWRDGQSKWLLRQVLYRHVPRGLIERPKMGFEVPIGLWLRGALRDWAAALLDPVRLRREGLFNAGEIDRMWRQHLAQSHNWGLQLWPVLMVQAWLEGAR